MGTPRNANRFRIACGEPGARCVVDALPDGKLLFHGHVDIWRDMQAKLAFEVLSSGHKIAPHQFLTGCERLAWCVQNGRLLPGPGADRDERRLFARLRGRKLGRTVARKAGA